MTQHTEQTTAYVKGDSRKELSTLLQAMEDYKKEHGTDGHISIIAEKTGIPEWRIQQLFAQM